MNFFRLGMTAAFAASVALDVASSARASVVFDNFAPANAFNGSNFFSIYGGSRFLDSHGEPVPDRDRTQAERCLAFRMAIMHRETAAELRRPTTAD